ncbi:MAG: hypothetical protein JWO67_4508 [Streptosporangiaceae bacterium]|nr:hypothetical protein [Streptosporangiaceae bacterium]
MSVTTAVVSSETVEDPDPSISRCGECPEGSLINVARWAVTWTGAYIDGEPAERREYCCDGCLGALVRYARQINEQYGGFTPPEVAELELPAWVCAA